MPAHLEMPIFSRDKVRIANGVSDWIRTAIDDVICIDLDEKTRLTSRLARALSHDRQSQRGEQRAWTNFRMAGKGRKGSLKEPW